jgi:hypothetical protein
MTSTSRLLNTLAAAGAAAIMLYGAQPAEARTPCPIGTVECGIRRCCPAPRVCPSGTLRCGYRACCPKKVAPKPSKPRCLQAVRDPGPGGSVKIKCIRWGQVPLRAACKAA